MEEEKWKDIEGYEKRYMVSDHGNVKSLNWENTGKEKKLKQGRGNQRYYKVVLCKNGEKKSFRVHQLVAKAFLENPENKKYVDHLDGNILNNDSTNLRWVSAKENANNPITAKRQIIGLQKYWSKKRKINGDTDTTFARC